MRAYRGRSGAWFRTARATRTGHIAAGGVDRVVTFTEVDDPALAERLDGAPARVLGARPRSGRTTGPARNASTGLRHPGPPTPLVQRVKKFPDAEGRWVWPALSPRLADRLCHPLREPRMSREVGTRCDTGVKSAWCVTGVEREGDAGTTQGVTSHADRCGPHALPGLCAVRVPRAGGIRAAR
ncbi:DUF2255 family protein [Streptomyces sp. NBC_01643]|nr:DUF2255 family protein [Streptomyces sp. NBC_01643]